MKKRLLVLLGIFLILLSYQVVGLGVTYPKPSTIYLTEGMTSDFEFKLITSEEREDLYCSFYVENKTQLKVEFDDQNLRAKSGSILVSKGKITASTHAASMLHTARMLLVYSTLDSFLLTITDCK